MVARIPFPLQMWHKILIGLLLGVLAGLALGESARLLQPVGTIFITLIRMVVMPVIFVSLVCGVTAMKNVRQMGRVAGKTLFLYMLTMAFAASSSMLLADLLNIGAGLNYSLGSTAGSVPTPPSMLDTMLNLFPANPFKSFVDGNVLQVIVFALFFGMAINLSGEAGSRSGACSIR